MKNVLIPLILVFIIAAAGAIYFAAYLSNSNKEKGGETQQAIPEKSESEILEDFNNFINQKNVFCTLNTEEELGNVKILEGSMYARTKNNLTGKIYNTLVVKDTMYTWEQGKFNGVKITKDKSNPKIEDEFTNSLKPYLKSEELDCKAENITPEELKVPTNVRFIDINSLMEGNTDL